MRHELCRPRRVRNVSAWTFLGLARARSGSPKILISKACVRTRSTQPIRASAPLQGAAQTRTSLLIKIIEDVALGASALQAHRVRGTSGSAR
jgi:hypothetical protein